MENNDSPISDFNFKLDASKFDKDKIGGITFESNTNKVLCDHDTRINDLKFKSEIVVLSLRNASRVKYIMGFLIGLDIGATLYLILT